MAANIAGLVVSVLFAAVLIGLGRSLWRAERPARKESWKIEEVAERRVIDEQFTEFDVVERAGGKSRTTTYVRRDKRGAQRPTPPSDALGEEFTPETANEKRLFDVITYYRELERCRIQWSFEREDPFQSEVHWHCEPGHVPVPNEVGQRISELWDYTAARQQHDERVIATEG